MPSLLTPNRHRASWHPFHAIRRVRTHSKLPFVASLFVAATAGAQSVPGFVVEIYSTPPSPSLLAWDANGMLFTGRDDHPMGSITPTFVSRITTDGAWSSYGIDAILDPDAPVVDTAGIVSGVAGSVLVGGLLVQPNGPGRVTAIRPDQTVVTLFEAPEYGNISELKFNSSGHLHFVSLSASKLYRSTAGEQPAAFFDTGAAPIHLAIADDGRLFTSNSAGTVQINAANGALLNASFAQFGGRVAIEFAQGGGFGNDLLALEATSGNLFSVSAAGVITQIGSGFGVTDDISIGPCGALFVSRRLANEVLRVRKPPTADLDGSGTVDGSDLGDLLGQWGSCPPGGCCPADLNGDGEVDGSDLGDLLGAWG